MKVVLDMSKEVLKVICGVIWMLLFTYIMSYIPKRIIYVVPEFLAGCAGLYFIFWLFRDKKQDNEDSYKKTD